VHEPGHKGARAGKPKYSACASAKTYKHLAAGSYEFYARAVGASGRTGSAATVSFRIT
jgi:predicted phage tail protein